MADQSALKSAFADFARTIAHGYDIGEVLYRLTDHVVAVFDVDGAGVSISEQDGSLVFVTATDEAVAQVESLQIDTRQGPCHDAYHSGDHVTVADLRVDPRWPHYRRGAIRRGMRAVAGIPMMVGDERIGALNLYARQPREWPADDMADAQLLADMATGYIINARALTATQALAAQLQNALHSRVVIEQAKGIIAGRRGIETSAAFELLRRHSRSHQLKLHDVARDVVANRLEL